MTKQIKWLTIAIAAGAGIVAFVLGFSPLTVLIIAFLLLCPLAIYFGVTSILRWQSSGSPDISGQSNAEGSKPKDQNH